MSLRGDLNLIFYAWFCGIYMWHKYWCTEVSSFYFYYRPCTCRWKAYKHISIQAKYLPWFKPDLNYLFGAFSRCYFCILLYFQRRRFSVNTEQCDIAWLANVKFRGPFFKAKILKFIRCWYLFWAPVYLACFVDIPKLLIGDLECRQVTRTRSRDLDSERVRNMWHQYKRYILVMHELSSLNPINCCAKSLWILQCMYNFWETFVHYK